MAIEGWRRRRVMAIEGGGGGGMAIEGWRWRRGMHVMVIEMWRRQRNANRGVEAAGEWQSRGGGGREMAIEGWRRQGNGNGEEEGSKE